MPPCNHNISFLHIDRLVLQLPSEAKKRKGIKASKKNPNKQKQKQKHKKTTKNKNNEKKKKQRKRKKKRLI